MDRTELKSLLIPIETSLKQAMQTLGVTGKQILFVTEENGRLLGTVTDGDIRRAILAGTKLTAQVQDIMGTNFVAVNADCSDIRKEAKKLMRQHPVDQIPVVNEKGVIVDAILWLDFIMPQDEDQNRVTDKNAVVIMAGGQGTRLDPLTKILPKPLIPVGDKPMIEHVLYSFHRNGFQKFMIIVNYKKEMIKTYFNETPTPYDLEYIEEDTYCGTAGGLSLLKDRLHDTFVVTNCDTLLESNYGDILEWHKDKNNVMTIVGSHKEIKVPYGVLNMSEGSFRGIDEKPLLDLFINTGMYVFEPEILDCIQPDGVMEMDQLIAKVREIHGERVGVFPHWGGWFDLGEWDEYRESVKKIKNL